MPEDIAQHHLIYTVSYMNRSQPIDRIVALDEFDMENVSALREHLRIPGMGLTTHPLFPRQIGHARPRARGWHSRPEFVPILNYDAIREFMARVSRALAAQASIASLRHRHEENRQVRRPVALARSTWRSTIFYLLEQFVPGTVYHVDSIVSEREVLFAEPHVYGSPPLDVSHQGGVFTTRTLQRDTAETKNLLEVNRNVIEGLGYLRGVTHADS